MLRLLDFLVVPAGKVFEYWQTMMGDMFGVLAQTIGTIAALFSTNLKRKLEDEQKNWAASSWSPDDVVSNKYGKEFGASLAQNDEQLLAPVQQDPDAYGILTIPVTNMFRAWDDWLVQSGAVTVPADKTEDASKAEKKHWQCLQRDILRWRADRKRIKTLKAAKNWQRSAGKLGTYACMCKKGTDEPQSQYKWP